MADDLNPTERELMVELFRLGQAVSSYVLRAMGAEAEQSESITTEDEFRLGSRLVELGTVVAARAAERVPIKTYSATGSMHDNTRNLIQALQAVNVQLRQIAHGIVSEQVTPEDQVEFAELVIRVGELIKLHAWEIRGYK